jgi:hypothetical protein
MWAFEVLPPPGSVLKAVLYLFADKPEAALSITISPEGNCAFALTKTGADQEIPAPDGFRLHPYNGEDLQGIYWGGLIELPLKWLSSLGGRVSLNTGDTFYGNFYKLCDGEKYKHFGSFYPADFFEGPYLPTSCGKFLVAGQLPE